MPWDAVSGRAGRHEGGRGRERPVPMGKTEIAPVRVSLGHAGAVLLSKGMTIA
jgi:hypothetical protein